ncbi:MAG: AmmeMemoRadiSam system protein A [Anaerolineae bacterium]|nr:AmmeMemoRadiSam system protein A [Anaerolineae bacterium]
MGNLEILGISEKKYLLAVARETIEQAVLGQKENSPVLEDIPEILQEPYATFVTLRIGEQLRGCIGSLSAHRPLFEDVQHNALAAAFDDPRFSPVQKHELEQIRIEISVLTKPELLEHQGSRDLLEKLRPNIDGVIIEQGWHRATFLPQVWEQIPWPEKFLTHLCHKAGLAANAWQWPDLKVFIYQVQKFEEDEILSE